MFLTISPASCFSVQVSRTVLVSLKVSCWLGLLLSTVLSVELQMSAKGKTVSRDKICRQILTVTSLDIATIS